MQPFTYQNGQLTCENVPLARIATEVDTPVYVYSRAALLTRSQAVRQHAAGLVCYAVKANGNPALLRLLGETGLGADVTSGGELFLAQHAGIASERIIFSGVGKTRREIAQALRADIRALHVESEMELDIIAEVAVELGSVARVGVRVNPDIAAETHAYISTGQRTSKFGVAPETAVSLLLRAARHPNLEPVALAAHIGSQIAQLAPLVQAAEALVELADHVAAQGIRLAYLDAGGGLGIDYAQEVVPTLGEWVTAVTNPIHRAGYESVLEPGRALVGPAGALLTQVLYTKQQPGKRFVIVDAGMNDLLRPALYDAHHPIWPVVQPSGAAPEAVDVVGPICESGDWLGRERSLPPVRPGDLLAILQAGAYGFAMSSQYNGRLRPAEVLVSGSTFRTIRHRQTLSDLLPPAG